MQKKEERRKKNKERKNQCVQLRRHKTFVRHAIISSILTENCTISIKAEQNVSKKREKKSKKKKKATQRKSSHESRIKTKWMCGLDRCDSQNESKEEWKTQTTNGKWHESDGLTEKCSLTKSKRLKWLCAKIKINSIYFHFIFHLIVLGFLFSVGDTCEDCLLFNFLLIFLLVTLIVVFECVCICMEFGVAPYPPQCPCSHSRFALSHHSISSLFQLPNVL